MNGGPHTPSLTTQTNPPHSTSSSMLSPFEPQPPNTQHPNTDYPRLLSDVPREMMPVWRQSFRVVGVPGRRPNYLTPGGPSEEGILIIGDDQVTYIMSRSYPSTRSSSRSNSAGPPALQHSPSSSNTPSSDVAGPVANHEFPFSPRWTCRIIPSNVAHNSNPVTFSDGVTTWEQHHHSDLLASPDAYPNGMHFASTNLPSTNFPSTLLPTNNQVSSDASPLEGVLFLPMPNAEWGALSNTSLVYNLVPYTTPTPTPSTLSYGSPDIFFYPEQNIQQDQTGSNGQHS